MEDQSKDVIHLYANEDCINMIESALDTCDFDIRQDCRPKIEDLDNFKRLLRNEVDEALYTKLDSFISMYLKFYNN